MSFNEDWKEYKLEEVIDEFIDYRGKTPKKSQKGIPLITAKIVKDGFVEKPNEFISPKIYDDWMQRGMPKNGDVVLTTEAPLGEVAQIRFSKKIALAQRIITLRGKEKLLDNTFLKYLLLSPTIQHRLDARGTGTTVKGIRSSELRKIYISIPSYRKQKKIANQLETLNKKIKNNRKMNKTLEEMAQAVYKSWFVDYEPFQEEELKKGKLKEIINITLGNSPKSDTYNEEGEGLPLLNGAGDFKDGFPTQSRYSSNPKRIAKEGEILLCTRGTIGHVSFADTDYCIGRGVSSMRPKDEIYNEYVNLTVKYYLEKLKQGAAGSVIKGLTKSDMLNIPILKTNMEHFEKFHKILNPIFKKKMINRKENKSLKELRDYLLPKLMSGEIRVPLNEDAKEVN